LSNYEISSRKGVIFPFVFIWVNLDIFL